jgi:hypothetical protein
MSDYYKVLTARNPGNKENVRSFSHSRDDLLKSNIHGATQPATVRKKKIVFDYCSHPGGHNSDRRGILLKRECPSFRPNWLPPLLSPQASVSPTWNQRGGEATLACGWGGANSDDWRESLTLSIHVLCDSDQQFNPYLTKTTLAFFTATSSFLDDLNPLI